MTAATYAHIASNQHGKPYIEGTRIKVKPTVTHRTVGGLQPEQIAKLYPPRMPAQIYSALAYYYDHKDDIDRQIEEGERRE